MVEEKPGIEPTLQALLDESRKLSKRHLQQFSDIDPASLTALLEVWPRVTPKRKLKLLDGLASLLDSDTLVSFEDLGKALLGDAEPAVRARATRLLAESDDARLVPTLIGILSQDPDTAPRLEAAVLLGEFLLLGELEKLPERPRRAAEEALLGVATSLERPELRRRALEALGYSSRPEVPALIEAAYGRQDAQWVASALAAMGRSSDERWEEQVVAMLLNEDTRVRLAAAEAAGELGLQVARPILLKMLEQEDDAAVTAAAVWSLSQIGGEDVRLYLQSLLEQAEDEEQSAFIEDALDNLSFTEDMERFDLLAVDPDKDIPATRTGAE
jgi:HEAT repeat protein